MDFGILVFIIDVVVIMCGLFVLKVECMAIVLCYSWFIESYLVVD